MVKLSVQCSVFADEKTDALIWQLNSCHSYMASKYQNAGLLTYSWRLNASKEPGHCHLHSQGEYSTGQQHVLTKHFWNEHLRNKLYLPLLFKSIDFQSRVLVSYPPNCLHCVVNYTYRFPLVSSPFDPTVYANGPIFLLIPQ